MTNWKDINRKEIELVEGALRHNQYSKTIINVKNSDKVTKNIEKGKEDKHEEKLITLINCGKEIKCITKFFKVLISK